jgi:hypothetical protein
LLHFASAGAHGFEHFGHLEVLLKEVVDLGDLNAGALGYSLAAAAVEVGGVAVLLVSEWSG